MYSELNAQESPAPVGDVKCELCELLVTELDKLIGDNATDAKINATIYELCSKLPSTVQAFVSDI